MQKIYSSKMSLIVFFFSLSIIFLSGCCQDEEGKIPITTSSCEARESYLQGKQYAENLQNQKALEHYEKAIELDSNFALAYYGAALAQGLTGQLFEYLEKAVSLADQVSEGERLLILGVQAGIERNFKKQEEYYTTLVKKYPKDENAFYQLGNFYFAQQQYEDAIGCYKDLIKLNPNFAIVYNQLGYSFRNIGKYAAAESALKKYIQLIPDNPNPYDSYGELLMKMGEYEASIEQYEKALKRDSTFIASCIGIASNLMYISNYNEARLQLERYHSRAKTDVEKVRARTAIAITYVDEGDYKAGIKELERLVKETENYHNDIAKANAYASIAMIQTETEDFKDAIANFTTALTTIKNSDLPERVKENSNFNLLFNRSIILAKQKKFKEAFADAEKFMSEAKKTNNLNQIRNGHELNGRIALNMKEYQKAIQELEQANLQNPYNLYRLAIAYENIDETQKAISYLEEVVNFNSFLSLNYAFCRNKAKSKLVDLRYKLKN